MQEQFRKIALWPAVYRYSVLPVIHNFDIRQRLDQLTVPILLINRQDDALSPETKTSWLAQHLPQCSGYHIVPGYERFFLYSEAGLVNPLIETFLADIAQQEKPEFVGNG
jgi:pimeloyl-ACP methyl ester carboxylesterase